MADPMELLERQYTRLRELEGAEFVRELPRFYETITAGPRPLPSLLAELRGEAREYAAAFDVANDELIPELVTLRHELVTLAPEADDSGQARPPGPSMSWTYGLSNFDQLAAGGPERLVENVDQDPSPSGTMLRILQSKLNALRYPATAPGAPVADAPAATPSSTSGGPTVGREVDDPGRRLRNAADRHRHALNTYRQAVNRRGGFQVQLLDMAIEQMNPKPREVHTPEDRRQWVEDLLMRSMSGWTAVEAVASGHTPSTDHERHMLEIQTRKLKSAADAVYEDLRFKLANARTTYVQRFATWVGTPGYGFVAGPCGVGAVAAVIKNQFSPAAVFVALAVAWALVPPGVGSLPNIALNAASLTSALIMAAVLVVVLVTVGFAASVGACLLLGVLFVLGQRSRT
jgi:hypothetical protein